MKTLVISYSLTGNNEALAKSISGDLGAKHITITEKKKRTVGTIILDNIFGRTPKIESISENLTDYELVLFVGPVWTGLTASPFRAIYKQLKNKIKQYCYISISGGAIGPNPKLADELRKKLGKDTAAVIDMHIADLLKSIPKATMKETGSYQINENDIKNLTADIIKMLKESIID